MYSKYEGHLSLKLIFTLFAIVFLIAGTVQIFFVPVISLGNGTGYDGIWYIEKAIDIRRRVDDYHLFRVFPSVICYYVLELFGLPKNWPNAIKAFQWLNLVSIQLFILGLFYLSQHLRLSVKESIVLCLLALFNFNFCREAFFNPVMTDTLGAALSMILLASYLRKRYILTATVGVMLLFTFSVALIVFLLYLLLANARDIQVSVKKAWQYLIYVVIIAAYVVPSLYWFYIRNRLTVYTFPDSIVPELFLFTLVLNSIFVGYFFGSLWRMLLPQTWLHILKTRQFQFTGAGLLLLYFIVKKILTVLNAYPKMSELRILLGNFWTYANLKPLIGIVDTFQFYGLIVLMLLLYWRYIVAQVDNLGHLVLLSFILFLWMMPEARHSLIMLPFMAYLLFFYVDFSKVNKYFIVYLGVVSFVLSRFYFPLHWAQFPPNDKLFAPETDQAIYQQFPAQYFFMFNGITVSYGNFLIITAVSVAIGLAFLPFKKHLHLKPKMGG